MDNNNKYFICHWYVGVVERYIAVIPTMWVQRFQQLNTGLANQQSFGQARYRNNQSSIINKKIVA